MIAAIEDRTRRSRLGRPVFTTADGPVSVPPWSRADLVVAAVLFVVAALWFQWLVAGASAQGVITGEEASITHRDALALRLGWQPSVWSTNVGGQLFYWIAGHLDPDYGLLYARPWKAAATALLSPLLYVIARRRLSCGRGTGAVVGVLIAVVPGVAVMSWVAIETPLDVVAGLLALLLVTSRRSWWWTGFAVAGVAVSFYTAGLASAAAVCLVGATRVRRWSEAALAAVGSAIGLAVVLGPLWWWDNGGIVVTGGGHAGAAPAQVGEHMRELLHYAVTSGASYYYFSDLPLFGGPLQFSLLAIGALVAVLARWHVAWPWALAGVFGVGLYAVSSGVPGSRRVVLVVTVVTLLTGVGAEVVARAARRRWARWASVPALAVCAVLALTMASAVVAWRGELATGERPLPIDWAFPVDPGGSQMSTLARLDGELRSGRLTPDEVGDGWGGTRTLAMLYMLDERAGAVPPLTPSAVLDYYWRSPDCPPLDGPACR